MSKYPHNTWHGWGNSRLQPLCAHRLQEIVQGRPILYESLKKEVEFALHPQRFVFSCPLYDAQGNDWPLATIFTHVFVGDISDYARSKAELFAKRYANSRGHLHNSHRFRVINHIKHAVRFVFFT